MIHWIESNVDQTIALGMCRSFFERFMQLRFCLHEKCNADSEQLRKLVIVPAKEIVEWTIVNMALRSVAIIVEHDDHWVQLLPDDSRNLHTGHLKCAVSHENKRAQL